MLVAIRTAHHTQSRTYSSNQKMNIVAQTDTSKSNESVRANEHAQDGNKSFFSSPPNRGTKRWAPRVSRIYLKKLTKVVWLEVQGPTIVYVFEPDRIILRLPLWDPDLGRPEVFVLATKRPDACHPRGIAECRG